MKFSQELLPPTPHENNCNLRSLILEKYMKDKIIPILRKSLLI